MVSIDSPLIRQHFRRFKKKILKDPGPLKSIKRIWAVKQQFMCTDWIMWPPGSKIQYRSVFSRNRLDSGRCSPAIAFIIVMISHDFSRYRSIAGKHIKNHPLKAFIYSLLFFADFCHNCILADFFTTAVLPPFPYIKQHVLRIFSSFRRELG